MAVKMFSADEDSPQQNVSKNQQNGHHNEFFLRFLILSTLQIHTMEVKALISRRNTSLKRLLLTLLLDIGTLRQSPLRLLLLLQLLHQIYVYVWHAILGCWGGVLTSSKALVKYSPDLVHPIQSPGNLGNLRDIAMDGIEKYGIRVIDPEKITDFYRLS